MNTASNDTQAAPSGPNRLLDCVRGKLGLKNDAALCRVLEVAPAVLSKIRHHRIQITSRLMIRIHFASGLSIAEIYDFLGLEHK